MKLDGFWFVIFFGAQVTIGYTSILNETQKQECGAGFIVVTGDCVDTDECQLGICHPWATCENTIGSYNCECQPNSSGDGVTCVPDTPCEPGWITFPGSKSCYEFSTNVEDWNSAQVSCAAQNASLICIDDEEELAFFGGRTTGATWMGLNDLETEGRYVCGNGEGLASRPWAYYNEANEPSEDTTKRCAASVHRFSWGFENCNATKRSACKAITSPCPEEWAEYPQLPGQCFAANNDHLTFHEAREKCEGMHPESKMITMSSVHENEFLGVQSETPRWLGLTKFHGESEWISVGADDDGYRNWLQPHLAEGRNGNDFDLCAVLLQSLWFVHDCSDEHFYVCEKSFPKSNRRDSLPQKRLELNERITKENCRSQR